jgi:hypothetical protein
MQRAYLCEVFDGPSEMCARIPTLTAAYDCKQHPVAAARIVHAAANAMQESDRRPLHPTDWVLSRNMMLQVM